MLWLWETVWNPSQLAYSHWWPYMQKDSWSWVQILQEEFHNKSEVLRNDCYKHICMKDHKNDLIATTWLLTLIWYSSRVICDITFWTHDIDVDWYVTGMVWFDLASYCILLFSSPTISMLLFSSPSCTFREGWSTFRFFCCIFASLY